MRTATIILTYLFLIAQTSIVSARLNQQTIAHRLLSREYAALKSSDDAPTKTEYQACIKQLNRLINDSVQRIQALKLSENLETAIKQQFSEVDQVLIENNYVCFINTETLIETLTPGIPENGGKVVPMARMSEYQGSHKSGTKRYRFDCDTGSIIFLAVFEVLKKPVVMVETPNHNFVRWRISPDLHVNWDVNDGESYTDTEHRYGALRTSGAFDHELEKRSHFMQDMNLLEVEMYHKSIEAALLSKSKRFNEAIAAFQTSIRHRPWAAMPRNNLAWMIATNKELQTPELTNLAVKMAQHAVSQRPYDNNFIDTLAAAYAANGQFNIAFQTEMVGNQDPDRLKVYANRIRPADTEWNKEPPK